MQSLTLILFFMGLIFLMTALSLSAKAHYNFVPNKEEEEEVDPLRPIMMTWQLSSSQKGGWVEKKWPYLRPKKKEDTLCNMKTLTFQGILDVFWVKISDHKGTIYWVRIDGSSSYFSPFEFWRTLFFAVFLWWMEFGQILHDLFAFFFYFFPPICTS